MSRHMIANYLLRLVSAAALLTVAFSHVPAVSRTASSVDLSAYAFPDGSLPVLCISGGVDRDAPMTVANPCDYCRLSSALVLLQPDCGAGLLVRLSQTVEQTSRPLVHAVQPIHVASKPLRGPPIA